MEAEVGRTSFEGGARVLSQGGTRSWKRQGTGPLPLPLPPAGVSRRNQPCDTLTSAQEDGHWPRALQNVEEHIRVLLSLQLCGNLLQQA